MGGAEYGCVAAECLRGKRAAGRVVVSGMAVEIAVAGRAQAMGE